MINDVDRRSWSAVGGGLSNEDARQRLASQLRAEVIEVFDGSLSVSWGRLWVLVAFEAACRPGQMVQLACGAALLIAGFGSGAGSDSADNIKLVIEGLVVLTLWAVNVALVGKRLRHDRSHTTHGVVEFATAVADALDAGGRGVEWEKGVGKFVDDEVPCVVLRAGLETRVPHTRLVRGDVMIMRHGERAPCALRAMDGLPQNTVVECGQRINSVFLWWRNKTGMDEAKTHPASAPATGFDNGSASDEMAAAASGTEFLEELREAPTGPVPGSSFDGVLPKVPCEVIETPLVEALKTCAQTRRPELPRKRAAARSAAAAAVAAVVAAVISLVATAVRGMRSGETSSGVAARVARLVLPAVPVAFEGLDAAVSMLGGACIEVVRELMVEYFASNPTKRLASEPNFLSSQIRAARVLACAWQRGHYARDTTQCLARITAICVPQDDADVLAYKGVVPCNVLLAGRGESEEGAGGGGSGEAGDNDIVLSIRSMPNDKWVSPASDIPIEKHCLEFDTGDWKLHLSRLKPLALACFVHSTLPTKTSTSSTAAGNNKSADVTEGMNALARLVGLTPEQGSSYRVGVCVHVSQPLRPLRSRRLRGRGANGWGPSEPLPFMLSALVTDPDQDQGQHLLSRGNSEVVLRHCRYLWDGEKVVRMTDDHRRRLLKQHCEWTMQSNLKVEAFAYTPIHPTLARQLSQHRPGHVISMTSGPSADDVAWAASAAAGDDDTTPAPDPASVDGTLIATAPPPTPSDSNAIGAAVGAQNGSGSGNMKAMEVDNADTALAVDLVAAAPNVDAAVGLQVRATGGEAERWVGGEQQSSPGIGLQVKRDGVDDHNDSRTEEGADIGRTRRIDGGTATTIEQAVAEQVFVGMVGLRHPHNPLAAELVDATNKGGVRLVYMSEQGEQQVKTLANKLGMETDWNTCIILDDDSPLPMQGHSVQSHDYFQPLPRGISAIRAHLRETDQLPLMVRLFAESSPPRTLEMIRVFQDHGDLVAVLMGEDADTSGALLGTTAAIIAQADLAVVCQPVDGRDGSNDDENGDGGNNNGGNNGRRGRSRHDDGLRLASYGRHGPGRQGGGRRRVRVGRRRRDALGIGRAVDAPWRQMADFVLPSEWGLHVLAQMCLHARRLDANGDACKSLYGHMLTSLLICNLIEDLVLVSAPPMWGVTTLWLVIVVCPLLSLTLLLRPAPPSVSRRIPAKNEATASRPVATGGLGGVASDLQWLRFGILRSVLVGAGIAVVHAAAVSGQLNGVAMHDLIRDRSFLATAMAGGGELDFQEGITFARHARVVFAVAYFVELGVGLAPADMPLWRLGGGGEGMLATATSGGAVWWWVSAALLGGHAVVWWIDCHNWEVERSRHWLWGALAWGVVLLAVGIMCQRAQGEVERKRQRRAKLVFDTKLGMHSPIIGGQYIDELN